MNSVTQKVEKLRSIASSLRLQGESIEAIIQMLGYALHTSEVEHIAYTQEASLERATEINSKIQHCVNMMYSVFRGQNPRVIITFSPQKRFILNPGDLVAKATNFNVYYLGYWDEEVGEFINSGITIYPGGDKYSRSILCVLSQYEIQDTWKITTDNLFYHTVEKPRDRQFAELSSDYTLFMSDFQDGEYTQLETTRQFSEHERLNYFFDLTLPGFGVNIYYPNKYGNLITKRSGYSDKWLKIKIHENLKISDLNTPDLERLLISGTIPVETPDDIVMKFDTTDNISFTSNGLIYIYESGHDNLESIHYLANKNRYSGSYLATNSDLSFLLSEMFPGKIRQTNGVVCRFNEGSNDIVLYYIPTNASLELTTSEKNRFIGSQSAYYVTKNIDIRKATRYNVNIILNLDLYAINDLSQEIEDMLSKYQYKFGVDIGDGDHQTPDYLEIKSLISKIDEIKYISKMDINYYDVDGNEVEYEELSSGSEEETTDYSSKYLTFTMIEEGNITWDGFGSVDYSIDNGTSWKTLQNRVTSETFAPGTQILIKSDLMVEGNIGRFEVSGLFDASGNIMSLIYSDSFKDKTSLRISSANSNYKLSSFEEKKVSFYSDVKDADINTVITNVNPRVDVEYSSGITSVIEGTKSDNNVNSNTIVSTYTSTSTNSIIKKVSNNISNSISNNSISNNISASSLSSSLNNISNSQSSSSIASITKSGNFYSLENNTLEISNKNNYSSIDKYYDQETYIINDSTEKSDSEETASESSSGIKDLISKYTGDKSSLLISKGKLNTLLNDKLSKYQSKVNYYLVNPYYVTFESLFEDVTTLRNAKNLILPATTIGPNCYKKMFSGCKNLLTPPNLPATILADECYEMMFYGCSSLLDAPELLAKYLSTDCYAEMFEDCLSLKKAPELPAVTLKDRCYYGMFKNCVSLTSAPELPAQQLSYSCYQSMFSGCISLEEAPNLKSVNLETGCYSSMFENCSSLLSAPALPALLLKKRCYSHMFDGCTSIKKAPILPATELISECYEYMFRNCSSLSYIKALFISTNYTSTLNWVLGVSNEGVFIRNKDAEWDIEDYEFGVNMIPKGWECINGSYDSSEIVFNETSAKNSSSSSESSTSSIALVQKEKRYAPYYFVITCEINSTMS